MLDYDTALSMLTDIVESKGADYVYVDDPKTQETIDAYNSPSNNACFYKQHDGTPGCIIGHLAVALELPALQEGSTGAYALRQAGLDLTLEARILIDEVQGHQDLGVPWGKALHDAVENTVG